MLPLSPALAEVLQRVHGRWFPKVELLTSSREHVRDYKEGLQLGTVSPANALEFSADGSVRLAAVATQQIGLATGSAFFTGLTDDLAANVQRALLFQLGTATTPPAWVQQVRLHLHRRPNGAQPIFDGRFVLHTYQVYSQDKLGARELVPAATPVEVAASAVTWSADEADVDFVLAGGAGVSLELPTLPVTGEPAGRYHLAFILTIAGGSNQNAAWVYDAAETDGEITQNGHLLSWWEVGIISEEDTELVQRPPTKASLGGFYALTKSTAGLGRAAIFFRTTSNTTATLTFSAAGGSAFDLGAAVTGDQEFVGLGETPAGTSLVFKVWNGAAWVEYVDGDFAAVDNTAKGGKNLTSVPEGQTKDIQITFNGSSDNLRTPVLRSAGMRDLIVTDVSRFLEGLPDAFYRVSDLLNHRMEIAELTLRLVRHGLQGDGDDVISRLVSSTANITAAHVRLSISAPGLARHDEFHADTYRVDDYVPHEAGLDLICVSVLDRLKLPIPKRKLVSNNWIVEPAKYDAVAGDSITSVFADVRDGVLGLAARYRGSVPQGGPKDPTGTQRSKIQGQIGAPGIGTAGKTELAKDVLEQLCRIAGGVLAPEQGRIHYRDLFGDKDVVAVFPEREIRWETTAPGLRQRAPRALISFQPATLGGNDWTKSIERDDAAMLAAIEQAGTEAGLRVDEFPESVSRWVRTANPLALGTVPADDAEGLADALVHRHVKAFAGGVLLWPFSCRIPWPHIQIGDLVTAENTKFVGRDPITGREIRGVGWAKMVIVGKNPLGTRFLGWPRAYSDITPGQRFVSQKGMYAPTVQIVVEDVDGRPDQARVRVRANPDTSEVTVRYKLLSSTAAVPERSTDGAVWTTYSGPVVVTRDASLIQRFVAWADWLGAWGPRAVAEIANDRRPQILTMTLTGAHVDDSSHVDTHTDVGHSDAAHQDSHSDNPHTDTHTDGHGDEDTVPPTETGHVDWHGDVAHEDIAHADSHTDVGHSDAAHQDAHTDITHQDGNYGVGVAIQADGDTGSVRAVARKHQDVAHSDHTDGAHSDVAHTDITNPTETDVRARPSVNGRNVVITLMDAGSHSDVAHSDHTDGAHSDVAHSDGITAITLEPGEVAYIGGLAYSRAAAAGVEGPLALSQGNRFTVLPVGTDKWVPA